MSTLETLEARIKELPADQILKLQDWLSEFVEEELELTDDFISSIERGKADLAAGNSRTHTP